MRLRFDVFAPARQQPQGRQALGEPILSSTLLLPGEEETPVFGWDVKEALDHQVDIVIDAGEVSTEPTTVVDLSSGAAEIARYGAGDATPFE